MKILRICPPHLSDVATLPLGIQKVIFQHYYFYTSDYLGPTLYHKKTNSNCCTAALAICLLLVICIALVLRLWHATGGARVLIWTC